MVGDVDAALVLAAGLGSRLRPVSGDLPKPLAPFAGVSILERNLAWLARSGVRRVVINLHHRADAIRGAIGDGARLGLQVRYQYEPELLGTAGALANVADQFDGPMLVVYGDNLLDFRLQDLVRAHACMQAQATLALFDPGRHRHTGIAGGRVRLDGEGRVVAFTEGEETAGLVNAGFYVVSPGLLELIPRGRLVDFGREVFPQALREGRPLWGWVMEAEGYCLGLDTPDAYARGLALADAGLLRSA